jgi:hypothetical protein
MFHSNNLHPNSIRMNKLLTIILLLLLAAGNPVSAQKAIAGERYGKTLNLGVGLGYYGYAGRSMPVLHANYEFLAGKNFTLAPFASFYAYRHIHYIGNPNNHEYYYYHEMVIPIGIKGSYYFDQILGAGKDWDFYLAGSLGFSISHSYWDNGYEGDVTFYRSASPLYADLHIGTEYHLNRKVGAFLDLSTGVSTIGLAIH